MTGGGETKKSTKKQKIEGDKTNNFMAVTFPDEMDDPFPVIDEDAMQEWVYPSNTIKIIMFLCFNASLANFPKRQYQFAITEQALYNNTLVCLPTGLGKTFIAAVIMHNFYRWFPDGSIDICKTIKLILNVGKIIFMAPSKQLVTQQLWACSDVMGIPRVYPLIITLLRLDLQFVYRRK